MRGRYENGRVVGRNKPVIITTAAISLILVAGVAGWWFIWRNDAPEPPARQTTTQPVAKKAPAKEVTKPKPTPLPSVQAEVDAWIAKQPGSYGVVVRDLKTGTQLAASNEHGSYFTASIYKLYVAYLSLQNVEAGTFKMTDPTYSGWSREKCIDEMIRTSHSPCAELMNDELGREQSNQRLAAYGLTDTSLSGFVTSAHDASIVLTRLYERRDLTEAHTKFLLDAMQHQIYRKGVPAGIPDATVYNKIGFYETGWHDASIVEHKSGVTYSIVILSKDAGSAQLADLAKTIAAKLRS